MSVSDLTDDTTPGESSGPAETEPTDAPATTSGSDTASMSRVRRLEREGDIAADYLEELLDIADLDGDIDMDVEDSRASVSIVGDGLGDLVGEDGRVLDALQELTRLAVVRQTGERSRLMLDIDGFRAKRRAELVLLAEAAIRTVQESGEPESFPAMNPFERKVGHDAVASAGLRSDSEGVEPKRHVVVHPAP